MKSLYKKIGVVVLSGMIVSGGFISSGSNVHAFYLSGYGSVDNMKQFAKQEGFSIIYKKSSEAEISQAIKQKLESKNISQKARKRLLNLSDKESVEIKNIEDFIQLPKSGMQLHKIKVGSSHYLIQFDEESIYSACRVPEHKFYKRENQRNYEIVYYLSQKYNYDIVLLKDVSSYPLSAEMNAQIRSMFKGRNQLIEKLVKEPQMKFKDADSFRLNLKSNKNVFKSGEYYRVGIGDLNFIIKGK